MSHRSKLGAGLVLCLFAAACFSEGGAASRGGSALIVVEKTSAAASRGGTAVYPIHVAASSLAGRITLGVKNLPNGAEARFTHNPIEAGETSSLIISSTKTMAVGRYTVTLLATSSRGGISETALIYRTLPPALTLEAIDFLTYAPFASGEGIKFGFDGQDFPFGLKTSWDPASFTPENGSWYPNECGSDPDDPLPAGFAVTVGYYESGGDWTENGIFRHINVHYDGSLWGGYANSGEVPLGKIGSVKCTSDERFTVSESAYGTVPALKIPVCNYQCNLPPALQLSLAPTPLALNQGETGSVAFTLSNLFAADPTAVLDVINPSALWFTFSYVQGPGTVGATGAIGVTVLPAAPVGRYIIPVSAVDKRTPGFAGATATADLVIDVGPTCATLADANAGAKVPLFGPTPFDVFVAERFDATASDIEGRTYVGALVLARSYSFGLKLADYDVRAGLILGAPDGTKVDIHDTNIFGLQTVLSSNPCSEWNGCHIIGKTSAEALKLSAKELQVQAQTFADGLFALPATGEAQIATSGNLTLDPKSSRQLNVFKFDTAEQGATEIIIGTGFPDGATIVINVIGPKPSFPKSILNQSGVSWPKIIFNFSQATILSLDGAHLFGTVLAPGADFDFANGLITGQVAVKSFNGTRTPTVQINLNRFNGCVPMNLVSP